MRNAKNSKQLQKGQLARLMAQENLIVEHRPNLQTAFFDVEHRVLGLPVWKDMSDEIYDLFVGHEISHALNTPAGEKPLREACDFIDSRHPATVKQFLNIAEDIRIEKMIQVKYPGLKPIFYQGYGQLMSRDFFGLKNKDVNQLNFPDRINIHAKCGARAGVKFTAKEQAIVDQLFSAMTWDEMIAACKALYDFCRIKNHQEEPPPPPQKQPNQKQKPQPKPEESESEEEDEEESEGSDANDEGDEESEEDSEGGKDGDSDESDEEDEDSDDEDGNGSDGDEEDEEDSDEESESSKNSKNSGSEESDEESEEDGDEEDSEGSDSDGSEGSEGEETDEESEADSSYGNGAGVSREGKQEDIDAADAAKPELMDEPEAPVTQDAFNQAMARAVNQRAEVIEYWDMPDAILKNIIVPYKDVHANIRLYYQGVDIDAKLIQFRTENGPIVKWLLKEFMLRKSADEMARTRVAPLGDDLDMNVVHSYRFNDDLFEREEIVTEGQNHGLVMIMDCSGSMEGKMRGTIEQMLNLVMFARQAQIPFEVYGFGHNKPIANGEPWSIKGSCAQNPFKLRQYFHHKMTAREFTMACGNMLALSVNYGGRNLPGSETLGGTPLQESIVSVVAVVEEMKKSENVQKPHVIILTDGDGHPSPCRNGQSLYGKKVIIRDPKTKLTFSEEKGDDDLTPAFLRTLRARCACNVIGFYVISGDNAENEIRCKVGDDTKTAALMAQWNKEGYAGITEAGYNEYFIIPSDHIAARELPNLTNMTPEQRTRAAMDAAATVAKKRLVLTKFVKWIA